MQRSAGHYAATVLSSSVDPKERAQAALDLRRLGIWLRHEAYPRGTLREAAASREGELERKVYNALSGLLELVSDPLASRDLRINVAAALGEFGGPKEAKDLSENLAREEDDEVQVALIDALGVIGGPDAVLAFTHALGTGTEQVRRAVIVALDELLARRKGHSSESIKQQELDPELNPLRDALKSLIEDPYCSEYLRVRTREMLYSLEP